MPSQRRHADCMGIDEVSWRGGPRCAFCGEIADVRSTERDDLEAILAWWAEHPLENKV